MVAWAEGNGRPIMGLQMQLRDKEKLSMEFLAGSAAKQTVLLGFDKILNCQLG